MIALVIFDLDGTLAQSKQPIDGDMAGRIGELLELVSVAVISGGGWPQFERQLLRQLPQTIDRRRLYLLPTSGTTLYRFEGHWREVYSDDLTQGERTRILQALDEAIGEAGLAEPRLWGGRIEDRGSQITFSGLGQAAPLSDKMGWDRDIRKRTRLQALLEAKLPGFAVRIGGSTSIDITRGGIDKASGIARFAALTGFAREAMLFIGDALYPGGNDASVQAAGIASIAVSGIGETRRVISEIIASGARQAPTSP